MRPDEPHKAGRSGDRARLASAVALTLAMAVLPATVGRKFQALYDAMDIPLPLLTNVFLGLPALACAVVFSLIAGGLVAKEVLVEDSALKRKTDLVAFIAGAALCSGYVLAMLLPIMLMHGHGSIGGG